ILRSPIQAMTLACRSPASRAGRSAATSRSERGSPLVDPDVLILSGAPPEPQPHDPDVKALLRLAVMRNIPVDCSRASADFLISSPLLSRRYTRQRPDFTGRRPGAGRRPRAGRLTAHLAAARPFR